MLLFRSNSPHARRVLTYPFVKTRLREENIRSRENNNLNKFRYIVFLALLLALPMSAKKVQPKEVAPLSAEQEQQFMYYWYAAKEAIAEENYDEAYMLLEFCRMLKPDDGQTLQFLGVIYESTHQPELAKATYKQAFEVAPRDQWRRYAEWLQQEESSYAAPEAIEVMETALKAYDEGTKGRKAKGERQKTNIVTDEELLEHLKKSYTAGKQWQKALEMQDALDRVKGPDDQSAYFRYRVYGWWGKYKEALEVVDNYLQENPSDVQFLLFRAFTQERLKVKDEQIYATYEKILELDAYNATALNGYAYLLAIRGGDLKKAEIMSEITIHQHPTEAAYLDTYGWILHLQGHNELAAFYLQRALQYCSDEEAEMKEVILMHYAEVLGRKNVKK